MQSQTLEHYNAIMGIIKSCSDANNSDCLEIISDGPCGRWVRATKAINKDHPIGYYYGTVKPISDMAEDESVFCQQLPDLNFYVDGDEECIAAVMQHLPKQVNKDLNCVAYENVKIGYQEYSRENKKFFIPLACASRYINKGEPVGYDYGPQYWCALTFKGVYPVYVGLKGEALENLVVVYDLSEDETEYATHVFSEYDRPHQTMKVDAKDLTVGVNGQTPAGHRVIRYYFIELEVIRKGFRDGRDTVVVHAESVNRLANEANKLQDEKKYHEELKLYRRIENIFDLAEEKPCPELSKQKQTNYENIAGAFKRMAEATMKHEEKSEFFENSVTYYQHALSVLAALHKKRFVDSDKNMKYKREYLKKIVDIHQLKKEIDLSSKEEVDPSSIGHLGPGIFGSSLGGESSEGSPSAAPQQDASTNASTNAA